MNPAKGFGVFAIASLVSVGLLATGGAPVAAAPDSGPVTFTKDVAPILQRSCQACHRPGSMAPMSLLTYEDARPWARAIKLKVAKREMPPWFIDRTVGVRKFKDDPSLTDREIDTIARWVDAGAPRGNPADMPPARDFGDPNEWGIGTPDLVIMGVPTTVKAADSDRWTEWTVESGLTEDRYLKAVETKPGLGPLSKQGTHHAIASLVQDGGDDTSLLGAADDRRGASFLNEYAVGKNGDVYPEGSGRLIRAGAKIRVGMHYHSIGTEVIDQPRVGLVFYPKGVVPKYQLLADASEGGGGNADLDIPAGEDNVRHDGYVRLVKPTRLNSYQPHMHNRGKAQCLTAIHPNARVETLNCVNNFQFGWMRVYVYADDVAPLLPAGTILQVTSWHDNTAANRYNPDPTNWAGYGQRTVDDMSHSWLTFVYLTDEDFKQQVEERRRSQTN